MEKWYLNQYYIFNTLICFVYPVLRIYGIKTDNLQLSDSWGYQKESHIITGIGTLIILKFMRHYSGFKKFLNDIYFFTKTGTLFLLIFIKPVFACWYLFGCISINI
jgi:hypothetical protein